MGITVFKIFIWGGISSDIRSDVLRLRLRVSVKLNFRPYIRRYTSPNENFEYSYPLTMLRLRTAAASCIKPLASCIYSLVNQCKATIRNDVEFPTVYGRIYCRKFLTLSNQTSRYKLKCIRSTNLLNP